MRLRDTKTGKVIFMVILMYILIGGRATVLWGQEVTEELIIDPYTVSLVCAAAAIIGEDEELAGWFATNVDNPEGIEYFTQLFTYGLKTGDITSDEVADTVEGCIHIRTQVEALE